MSYSTRDEVREMIKDDALNALIGDSFIEFQSTSPVWGTTPGGTGQRLPKAGKYGEAVRAAERPLKAFLRRRGVNGRRRK